jgi:16S rRNA processing protein RimM
MVEKFVVGVVRAPFGVKGFVKVQSYSGEIDHLVDLEKVLMIKNGVEKYFVVEETGGSASSFVMKFEGVETPEAAKLLTGWELLVSRDAAAPLETDEYYIEDLKGLAVMLDDEKIGVIKDVLDGAASQLVEIALVSGESRLVPFKNEYFGPVDLQTRTAVLIDGWILE